MEKSMIHPKLLNLTGVVMIGNAKLLTHVTRNYCYYYNFMTSNENSSSFYRNKYYLYKLLIRLSTENKI